MSTQSHPHLIRFFSAEPELLRHVPEQEHGLARSNLVVERLSLHRDSPLPARMKWDDRSLGLLVLEGLLVRQTTSFGRRSLELLGPGDVVRPQAEQGETARVVATWNTLAPTGLAVLDRRFMRESARWSGLTTELFDRVARRATALGVQLAIAQLPRLESRLVCLIWFLAQRWGTVRGDGMFLRLPLTHDVLAGLTTARRTSVSSALARLREGGLLEQPEPGTWLLPVGAVMPHELDTLGHSLHRVPVPA